MDLPVTSPSYEQIPPEVAPTVKRVLVDFLDVARSSLGDDLRSVVLFGSAAEGKMRPTSDVNTILVLSAFDSKKVDLLAVHFRAAHAAIRLSVMFLLEGEIQAAVEAFAVKFADILRRRRVLYGADPFVGVAPSRGSEILRLKQVLLNLTLRLREQYSLRSLRDEQITIIVADTAGPLRTCAATILELEGGKVSSPKEALEIVARSLPSDTNWSDVLSRVSKMRERQVLPPHSAAETLLRLIDLSQELRRRAEALR